MSHIMRVTAAWTGFAGAPGYSNFFFKDTSNAEPEAADAAGVSNSVSFFLEAIKGLLPPAVKIGLQTDVAVLDDQTGQMVDVLSNGGFSNTTGTAASGPYSAASGVVVTWRTAGIRNGRRVRGRTFLVPTANTAYEADGSLAAGAMTTIQTAANALLVPASNRWLGVWSRPSAPGASDGVWYPGMTATIPDRVAVLRSRRA